MTGDLKGTGPAFADLITCLEKPFALLSAEGEELPLLRVRGEEIEGPFPLGLVKLTGEREVFAKLVGA